MCVCVCVCVCACVSDIFPPAHVPAIFRTKTHVAHRKSVNCLLCSAPVLPLFTQSEPSAGSGLNLDQPVSLLITNLLVHQHESHRRLAPFSHCIPLQRPSIVRDNYGTRTKYSYTCSWVCTAAVSSKHDRGNLLFILTWSEEATLALVVKNGCRKWFYFVLSHDQPAPSP